MFQRKFHFDPHALRYVRVKRTRKYFISDNLARREYEKIIALSDKVDN